MRYGKTRITVCRDSIELGKRAANEVAAAIRQILAAKENTNIIFAAGESQMTFLDALAFQPGIEWSRVICFNMDDFWDPRLPEQYTCGYQTYKQLYEKVTPAEYHLVDFKADDPQAEAERFAGLMRRSGPFDILCQGIGTSGHLALNEPGQARFNDQELVRVVDIAEQSKKQLIDDPNFRELGYIPEKGITMTIPAMLAAKHVFSMVPLGLKKEIITRLLDTPEPDENLPASILSTVESKLFLDRDSCPDSLKS